MRLFFNVFFTVFFASFLGYDIANHNSTWLIVADISLVLLNAVYIFVGDKK